MVVDSKSIPQGRKGVGQQLLLAGDADQVTVSGGQAQAADFFIGQDLFAHLRAAGNQAGPADLDKGGGTLFNLPEQMLDFRTQARGGGGGKCRLYLGQTLCTAHCAHERGGRQPPAVNLPPPGDPIQIEDLTRGNLAAAGIEDILASER